MKGRIFGMETEYGCLSPNTDHINTPDQISQQIKDHIFSQEQLGVLDVHYRGRDEPPGNGGFLFNSGRLYLDMGHLEFATPECTGLFDLVAADRAGEVLIQRALMQIDPSKRASIIKNNIDHYTGATFGCHENYLVRRDVSFSQVLLPAILPFFVTRQIFSGAGRVGAYQDGVQERKISEPKIDYQISQRSDHIVTDVYQWIQFSRAIINTRDEPLADWSQFRRLHLLLGDSNMSEYATALKVGTTCLVLQLIEEGIVPSIRLLDAVSATREISRDTDYSWEVQLEDERPTTALEIQRYYLELSERNLRGRDTETNWVLDEWRFVLDGLTYDPISLIDRVDWIAKKWLLEKFMHSENLGWDDPWIQSLDLEYHNLDPERGLYFDLLQRGRIKRVVDDKHVRLLIGNPPNDTRALARSRIMHGLTRQNASYAIDWDCIYVEEDRYVNLDDPFATYELIADEFVALCLGGSNLEDFESLWEKRRCADVEEFDNKRYELERFWAEQENALIVKKIELEKEESRRRNESQSAETENKMRDWKCFKKEVDVKFEEIDWLINELERKKRDALFI